MECVEAALKTSIRKELALKTSPQSFFDDFWTVNAPNGVASDDFFVDELLDFSNGDGFVEGDKEEEEKVLLSVSPQEEITTEKIGETPKKSGSENGFDSVPGGEFPVPAEDMESLEWLSHFVDDSFSEFSPSLPAGTLTANLKRAPPLGTGVAPKKPVQEEPCFKSPVPARARSKRTRAGCRVWSLGSPTFTESSSTSSSSSSSSSPTSPILIYMNPTATLEPGFVTAKKPKRKPAADGGAGGGQAPRRCSHCGVQKTPQWRTGPLGAKTLCNACGVRFKSGRLFPEYRPACSPTFSSELHSNHHRKVLEMRRKKEMEVAAQPAQPPSFEG